MRSDVLGTISFKINHYLERKVYATKLKGRVALRKVIALASPLTDPDPEEIVLSLVMNTAALEIIKGEHVELAPIRGTCGVIKLSGNGLPVFEYRVFEKTIMEFIKVTVAVSRPNTIRFIATIDALGTQDPARHGEEVECKDIYKEPFNKLALNLFNYFPFYRKK